MSEPSKMPPKKNSSWPEVMRTLGPYMNIGWMFVVAMVLGIYGGYKADIYLGTKPWLMVVGALLGMAAGFYNFFIVVLRK
jgi:ATP synthase protein I